MEYTSIEVTRLISGELPEGLAEEFIRAGCPNMIEFGGETWAIRLKTEEENGEWVESSWDEHDFFGHRPSGGSFVGNGTYYLLYHLSPVVSDPSTAEGAENYGDWIDNLGRLVAQQFMAAKMHNRAVNDSPTARAEWLRNSGLLHRTDWYLRRN